MPVSPTGQIQRALFKSVHGTITQLEFLPFSEPRQIPSQSKISHGICRVSCCIFETRGKLGICKHPKDSSPFLISAKATGQFRSFQLLIGRSTSKNMYSNLLSIWNTWANSRHKPSKCLPSSEKNCFQVSNTPPVRFSVRILGFMVAFYEAVPFTQLPLRPFQHNILMT